MMNVTDFIRYTHCHKMCDIVKIIMICNVHICKIYKYAAIAVPMKEIECKLILLNIN